MSDIDAPSSRWTRFRQKLSRRWLKWPELPVLAVALATVASVWGFVELADEVAVGDTRHFDQWVIDSLRYADPAKAGVPRGPDWLREFGRDFTALGGIAVMSLVTAAVSVYLLLHRKYHATLLMVLAVVSGVVVSSLLKQSFSRPRPGVSQLTWTFSSSFPSGHSMVSAIVYLTLGTMLARTEPRRVVQIYFIALAMLLTFLVGASRVYLLVHYPTDVLGGWTAGLAWALVWWLIARYLQRRGAVEENVD